MYTKIHHSFTNRQRAACVAAIITGIAGLVFTYATHAATFLVPAEAESGTIAGAAGVSPDSLASGGSSVIFGLSASSQTLTAIATYQSIGLYWNPAGGSQTRSATVSYRAKGATDWKTAMPMWYDSRTIAGRPAEYRSSITLLNAATTYEVRTTLPDGTYSTTEARTWTDPENLPIAKTVTVPTGGAYTITEGGTPEGYVVYTANPGSKITASTVRTDYQNGVTVNASYVIVRGLTIVGGTNGVMLGTNANHVVIDGNDISGWGPTCATYGGCDDLQAGVGGRDTGSYSQITVQRNKIHNPNYGSNSWPESGHPTGPRGITMPSNAATTNNVFRYNEITGDLTHSYNDGMGNNNNFTTAGFPNADSDVYGNIVTNVMDDALEIEGANRNVRVWGNYIDQTFTGIATAYDAVGPLYIFRNVEDRSDYDPRAHGGYNTSSTWGYFGKLDDSAAEAGGRRYYLHNTTLQRPGAKGTDTAIYAAGGSRIVANTVSRNNLWQVADGKRTYVFNTATNDDFDYDLTPPDFSYSGNPYGSHLVRGLPIFAAGNGNDSGSGGMYQLAPNSPGYDAGAILPGFNDGFAGSAPDIGAQEAGAPRMEFGVNAYR